jgi:hypothetical protein
VVCVTCKNKQNIKWKTHDRETTTITTTKRTIKNNNNKGMENVGNDNRGKKMRIIFCLYQQNFDKQQR